MRMKKVSIFIFIGVIVVTSGCAGILNDTPLDPSPNSPVTGDYPEGFNNQTDSVNLTKILEVHEEKLEGKSVHYTETVSMGEGHSNNLSVKMNPSTGRYIVRETRTGTDNIRTTYYDGESENAYTKIESQDNVRYITRDPGTNLSSVSLTRNSRTAVLLQSFRYTLTRTPEGFVANSETAIDTQLEKRLPVQNVKTAEASITVSSEGVIKSVSIDVVGEEAQFRTTQTVSSVGQTDVSQPEWLGESQNQYIEFNIESSTQRYIAINYTHGPVLPNGTEVFFSQAGSKTTMEKTFTTFDMEPGQTYYIEPVSHNTSEFTFTKTLTDSPYSFEHERVIIYISGEDGYPYLTEEVQLDSAE